MTVKRLLVRSFSVMAIAALIVSVGLPNVPLFAESDLEELEEEFAEKYEEFLSIQKKLDKEGITQEEQSEIQHQIEVLGPELGELTKEIEKRGGDWQALVKKIDQKFQEGNGEPVVEVRPGSEIEGDIENPNKTRVRARARVKEVDLCDLLDAASKVGDESKGPGKEFKKKLKGTTVTFKGHSPWVAGLICEFTKKSIGKAPKFNDYAKRKEYLSKVLKALKDNASMDISPIDMERLRVGEKLYWIKHIKKKDKSLKFDKKEKSMFVLRSYEKPKKLLLGMNSSYFKIKSNKETEKIKKGEEFLLRAYSLAALGTIIIKEGADVPSDDMDTLLKKMAKDFKNQNYILNTEEIPTFTKLGKRTVQEDPPKVVPGGGGRGCGPGVVRNPKKDKFVCLEWNGKPQVPASGIHGISLFEYKPMLGRSKPEGRNIRGWFIKKLNKKTGSDKPEGITFPVCDFRRQGQSRFIPETLIDETTKGKVVGRLEILAGCVVRIHYYTQPKGPKGTDVTDVVLDHEKKHFEYMREAWDRWFLKKPHDEIESLDSELKTFTDDVLNEGLEGDERFQYEREEVRIPWRLKWAKKIIWDFRAIPVGRLDKGKKASDLHTNTEVSHLSFRITRRMETEEPAIKLLGNVKLRDDIYEKAKGKWKKWFENNLYIYKNGFSRQFHIKGLKLDIDEGALDKDGNRVGRPELEPLLNEFKKETDPTKDDKKRKNPFDVFRKLSR